MFKISRYVFIIIIVPFEADNFTTHYYYAYARTCILDKDIVLRYIGDQ